MITVYAINIFGLKLRRCQKKNHKLFEHDDMRLFDSNNLKDFLI